MNSQLYCVQNEFGQLATISEIGIVFGNIPTSPSWADRIPMESGIGILHNTLFYDFDVADEISRVLNNSSIKIVKLDQEILNQIWS